MSQGRFSKIYPSKGRINLDGGKNSKFERSIIADNESPDAKNVVFTNGAAETREGFARFNATSLGSHVIDGLYTRRDRNGAETMIVFCGGSAFRSDATSFTTIASAQSVFTSGVRVATAQQENHMFIGNGGVIPYKYNGTDFTRHGVYPPTTAPVVASNGVGALDASADYRYRVTFVNSQSVESDVGSASATFTISATSGQNRLTSIPVAPQSWGVSARRIYRTEGNGTTYKLVTEIADNTTTTYDDNTPDSSLGVTAPTDNGVPPKYSIIIYHQGRLFMNDPANPSYVVYTDLNEPFTVGSLNFKPVGDDTSDLVKGLSVYNNSIMVHCERSQWLIYMPDTDDANWKTVRIDSPYGSKSPFCFLDFNGRQLFAAVQNDKFVGFAALSGASVEPSATLLTVSNAGSFLRSDRIEPDMFQVQETYLGNITGIVYKNKAWIAVTYGSGQTTNNRVYQMDFSISNLSKQQKESWVPFTGINASQFTVFGGNLYFGSSTANGRVYQAESGVYNDDGAAIDSYIWTKEFSGYDPDFNMHKDFRYANVLVDLQGSYFMDVYYRVDSDIGEGSQSQIDLTPGGSLWGELEWGTDTWGGGATQRDFTLDLGTTAGKRIQFKFTNQNTINQKFKVHGINFTYNMKGRR
jgi:hypothetical protein